MDLHRNGYITLGMIQDHAPNGPAQEKAAEIYRQAEADGASTERVMATVLSNGLNTGNWPWSPSTVDEAIAYADANEAK